MGSREGAKLAKKQIRAEAQRRRGGAFRAIGSRSGDRIALWQQAMQPLTRRTLHQVQPLCASARKSALLPFASFAPSGEKN